MIILSNQPFPRKAMNNTTSEHTRRRILLLITAVFLLVMGIYFRLYPIRTYASHDSLERASVLVINQIKINLARSLKEDFPKVSQQLQGQWLGDKLNATLRAQKGNIQKLIRQTARKLDMLSSKKPRYPDLLASDSFYYYRLSQQIKNKGTLSPHIKGSKYLNDMMLAPLGHWEPFNLHPYLGYGVYRIISLFFKDIPLSYALGFSPLVVMTLSLLAFLWVCRRLNINLISTLLAGLFFLLSPIFLKRSIWGWYDNDPYNTLFPLIILGILIYAIQNRKDIKRILASALICAATFALYALFWHGWMFHLGALVASGFVIILYNLCIHRDKSQGQNRNLLIFYSLIPIGVLGTIGLIYGPREFFILIQEGLVAINDFFKPQVSLWPNLYIGVGELHKAPLGKIIELTGHPIFFILSALGFFGVLVCSFIRSDQRNLYAGLIIAVFFALSLFLTFNAERFALLCLVPMSLLTALALDFISQKLIDLRMGYPTQKRQNLYMIGLYFVALMLAGLVILTSARQMPQVTTRIYNDIWQDTLIELNEKTPPNSIIHTWWSPGHFITSVAQRRVTFDGATINKPQAYWMARALIAQDEREALGILRMLDGSGNKAVTYLESRGIPLSESVDILNAILPLSKAAAQHQLRTLLPPQQKQELLELTHQRPPPAYILIYNELIQKNAQLSFVGKWDFKKIEQTTADPKALKQHLLSGIKPYVDFVWKMAGGQPRFSGILKTFQRAGDLIAFDKGVKVHAGRMQAMIDSPTFGHGVPYSIFYLDDNEIKEKKLLNAGLPYSLVLFKRRGDYQCALMDRSLARSLIMQLYFFEGKGFQYIHPFSHHSDLTKRTDIYVFRIDWGKFLAGR